MKKNRILFILLFSILNSFHCQSQKSKLIEKLIELNYKSVSYKSFELFKKKVDETTATENRVVYFKSNKFVFGIIYEEKNNSISCFYENVFTKKIHYYLINPDLNLTTEPISYDRIVSNLYYCYEIDFTKKFIAEYDVYFRVDKVLFSFFENDTISEINVRLKEKIPYPEFNDSKSIRKYNFNIDLLESITKKVTSLRKVENIRPFILYFFVCLSDLSPNICSKFDFKLVF